MDLVQHADSVSKLLAQCAFCDRRALFSLRRPGEKSGRVLIGGADKYVAACRVCYVQRHYPHGGAAGEGGGQPAAHGEDRAH